MVFHTSKGEPLFGKISLETLEIKDRFSSYLSLYISLFASKPLLFYTIDMIQTKKIKRLYKISAALILVAAVLVTGYFILLGMREKSRDTSPQTNESVLGEDSDSTAKVSQDYLLILSEIDVSVPIILNVNGNDQQAYNKALEGGVAHLKGSAMPGRAGNVFIFGHSSYFPEEPGNYKEIFRELNNLNPGSIMEIQGSDARHIYRVTDKKIVGPSDVEVAAQNPNLRQLTIMTCWPLGTTEQRLVVVGELVEN